jgi:hypothetical protein
VVRSSMPYDAFYAAVAAVGGDDAPLLLLRPTTRPSAAPPRIHLRSVSIIESEYASAACTYSSDPQSSSIRNLAAECRHGFSFDKG